MRPPLDLELPRRRARPWVAIAISVAIHGLLLFVTINPWLPPLRRTDRPPLLPMPPATDGPVAVEMVFLVPAEGQGSGDLPGVERVQPEVTGPRPEPTPLQPAPEARPVVVSRDTGAFTPIRPPDAPSTSPRGGIRRIGPALGEGTLWVRPLPLPPRELAEALTQRSHIELVDSAVSAIVQAYLDSVMTSPSRPGAPAPSWTTDIQGQTFGIDSKYIYLGPLKIPAALLALLPIQGGGNMDLQEGRRLAAIRADLQYAARRAETMDDFRKAIREIRERRDQEREFERNRRSAPPPIPPDTSRSR
ncbi:MAG TPA: hypothetical protein VMK53_08335 [Gemmatimonadales bacterium]|nr:hypothetical protein [Gemmatimonadales bacterium]